MRRTYPQRDMSQPPQVHIPTVYHHQEQRGPDPRNKINVTTYVFQTNRNERPVAGPLSRPGSALSRSMTPQPTATYYSEERAPSRTGRPMRHSVGARPTYYSQPPPGSNFYPDQDSIDNSHVLHVEDAKNIFEANSLRNRGYSTRSSYNRHTNRSATASAPPSTGRYEYRTRSSYGNPPPPSSNYDTVRGTSSVSTNVEYYDHRSGVPVRTEPIKYSPPRKPDPKRIGRSSTSNGPIYQRLVPAEDMNGYDYYDDGEPAWQGTLRSTDSRRYDELEHSPPAMGAGGGYAPSQHSNYSSLNRNQRSRSLNPSQVRHDRGRDMFNRRQERDDDPYATDDELINAHLSSNTRYAAPEPPVYRPQSQQAFVNPSALKASVNRAAAAKQHGGLLAPAGYNRANSDMNIHHFNAGGGYSHDYRY